MKDKKFLILCGLGIVWLVMFIAMLCGAKIHPRVEIMVYAVCVGWFAFWTISSIRDYFRKDISPPAPGPEQMESGFYFSKPPTQQTEANAKAKSDSKKTRSQNSAELYSNADFGFTKKPTNKKQ